MRRKPEGFWPFWTLTLTALAMLVAAAVGRCDDFLGRVQALETKNAARVTDRHTVSPVDPFAKANATKKGCGCTSPADCDCGASCSCAACAPKPGDVKPSEDPARPWVYENGWGGWDWYRAARRTMQQPYSGAVLYSSPLGFAPNVLGGFRGVSCGRGG